MGPGKAIIAGGSVGGLFVGVLLQQAGWDVTVLERSSVGLEGKGAGLVPQREVSEILDKIGRDDVLRSGVIARERIFLSRAGEIIDVVPTPQSQISWDLLYEAFRMCMRNGGYQLRREIVRASTTAQSAAVEFADGSVQPADLVIGADGIGSVVRKAVAPDTHPRYAGYAAFRGLAPEVDLPPESAKIVSDRFTFFNAPRSQFLGYLVAGPDGSIEPGKRRYNWVWYRSLTDEQLKRALTSDSGERRIYSAPPAGLSRQTRDEFFSDARTHLPSSLSGIVTRERKPFLQAIFDYETPRMHYGRLALLGDAAYVVRPHTAMGVAKAAADAMELRDALVEEVFIDGALHRYSARRMIAGAQIARYGQRLGERLEIHTPNNSVVSYEEDEEG